MYSVVSLFSGCGGTDLGFEGGFDFLGKHYEENPFDVIWANDIDKSACQTYQSNFKKDIICADIRDILQNNYRSLLAKPLPKYADVVIGGFPCQDFSLAGKRKGFDSERGTLYQSMVEVVKRVQPTIFLAENVKGLLTIHDGDALRTIIKDFSDLGYEVRYRLLHAADYGIPQNRERVIIVGTKFDKDFKYPDQTHNQSNWIALKDCIGDLESIESGKASNHFWSKAKMFIGTQGNSLTKPDRIGPTMRAEHHGNIEFHWNGSRRLSAREAARIQSFPDNFVFYPSTSSAYRQIGNAVPPVLAWHLAQSVREYLSAVKEPIFKRKDYKKNTKEASLSVSIS